MTDSKYRERTSQNIGCTLGFTSVLIGGMMAVAGVGKSCAGELKPPAGPGAGGEVIRVETPLPDEPPASHAQSGNEWQNRHAQHATSPETTPAR